MKLRGLLWVFVFLPQVAVAQSTTVRMSQLVLIQEKSGWRAVCPLESVQAASLFPGDLVTRLDGEKASRLGPLDILAEFNVAFERPLPARVIRGGKEIDIVIWRGEGKAPPRKGTVSAPWVSKSVLAPNFTLTDLKGQNVTLSELRGKWVLVSFWATWCAPCQAEAPVLNQLAAFDPRRLQVLGVAVKDDIDKMTAFAKRIHAAYTIVDGGPLTKNPALAYGVGSPTGGGHVPINVLVRPNGTIAYVEGGYEEPSPLSDDVLKQVRNTRAHR